ncbi:hypothetical protein [Defluviimonas salinarum]|uniref:Uncharacterized protein n=1 Tax=Defluviimonas salinarum TaxID=2992147 RepID=A0ABT3J834_9RHOB|nr:hypothetical protein [Defluviimonas salinarum]MCW3783842.1 hypothetical protein [Defluviimonas salinarum]
MLLPIAALAFGAAFAGDMSQETQETTVHRFSDLSVVDGAKGTLTRMDNGVYLSVDTHELAPGHAVTMWWVVFNEPSMCSDDECGENDVLMMDADGNIADSQDGSVPINPEAWEAAKISVLRADGLIIPEGGMANFRGHLPVGDTTEALGGPGLLDPHKAEVHSVIRTHGKVAPDEQNAAVNSFAGGCDENWPNAPCEDLQFTVFKPTM